MLPAQTPARSISSERRGRPGFTWRADEPSQRDSAIARTDYSPQRFVPRGFAVRALTPDGLEVVQARGKRSNLMGIGTGGSTAGAVVPSICADPHLAHRRPVAGHGDQPRLRRHSRHGPSRGAQRPGACTRLACARDSGRGARPLEGRARRGHPRPREGACPAGRAVRGEPAGGTEPLEPLGPGPSSLSPAPAAESRSAAAGRSAGHSSRGGRHPEADQGRATAAGHECQVRGGPAACGGRAGRSHPPVAGGTRGARPRTLDQPVPHGGWNERPDRLDLLPVGHHRHSRH